MMPESSPLVAKKQTLNLLETIEWQIKHIPLKRLFDIAFSLLTILFTLPIIVVIALAVKLSSRGPLIYAHERVGRGGKPFFCYKFRTMYADADKRLEQMLESDPAIREEWEKSYKLKNDPRVTPVGIFLRKTSLDEFPQFINVIKGDLSVVGPRPVVREEVEKHLRHKAAKILSIRPGITGLWQISGRNDVSYERRIQFDETYVDTHSFYLDLKVILKTIPVIIFSRGAY